MATGDAYSLNQLFGGRDIGTVVEVRALPSGRPPRLALRCSRLKGRFALSGSPLARFAPRDPAKPLTRCAPRRPLRCRPRGEPRRIVFPTPTCASVASCSFRAGRTGRNSSWWGCLCRGPSERRWPTSPRWRRCCWAGHWPLRTVATVGAADGLAKVPRKDGLSLHVGEILDAGREAEMINWQWQDILR